MPLTLVITSLITANTFSQTCTITATTNGNWKLPAVWGGTQPVAGDVICIPSGINVTIPTNESILLNASGTTTTLNILNGGTLTFGNPNSNIQFSASSVVNWYVGGNIVTPTPSNQDAITIGSTEFSHADIKNGVIGPGSQLSESGAALLPVELTLFKGVNTEGKGVVLEWRTATEFDNAGFYLQRSNDGRFWDELALVPGHGTTTEEKSYFFTDQNPEPGINYYRLRQVDYDGQFEYSKVISVEVRLDAGNLGLYPNPARNMVTLDFQSDYAGEATLTLYDLRGRRVKTQTIMLEGGAHRSGIELTGMPAGMYLAEMVAGRERWQERLVVK